MDKPEFDAQAYIEKITREAQPDSASKRIDRNLQLLARDLDAILTRIAGRRVAFSLVVHTNVPQYVSNTTDREGVSKTFLTFVEKWKEQGGRTIATFDNLGRKN